VQINWTENKKFLVPGSLLLIGFIGWNWLQAPSENIIAEVSQTISPDPIQSVVTIYITGRVAHPGVVELPLGARVIDAVNAAGGMTIKRPNINLARVLVDGEQILVEKYQIDSNNVSGKIKLNQADVSELETIPGIGPVMANRIIDYRTLNGSFRSFTDLDAISGIGPALMAEMQKVAVVE
jgi:competence protein ComEA